MKASPRPHRRSAAPEEEEPVVAVAPVAVAPLARSMPWRAGRRAPPLASTDPWRADDPMKR